MVSALNWFSIALAFVSGGLWLCAATVKVPTDIGSGFGTLVGVEDMTTGFKRQARWNSSAAVATAAAALFQAAARIAA